MCPALGPAWAPPRVGTARGVLTLEWPEARAAAQGGRTEASARGSASSSGPARLGQMEGRLSRRRTDGQLPSSQRCFQDRAGQDSGKALLGRCCRAPGTFAIPAPAALCRGGGTLSGASPPKPCAEEGAPCLGPASQGSTGLGGFPEEEGLPASSINSLLPKGPGGGAWEEGSLQLRPGAGGRLAVPQPSLSALAPALRLLPPRT